MADELEGMIKAPIVVFNNGFNLLNPNNMAIQFEVEGDFLIGDKYPCLDYSMVKAIYDLDGKELWKNWNHQSQEPLKLDKASSGLQVAMANSVHYLGLSDRVHRFGVDREDVRTKRTGASLSHFWDKVPLELIKVIYSEQGELIYKNQ